MRDDRGFTLLEVLVASLIAATALSVLWRSAASGLTAVRVAGQYEAAVTLAQAHLALAGRDLAEAPEDASGADGPFHWRVRVLREATAVAGNRIAELVERRGEKRPALYRVDVEVAWRAAQSPRAVHVASERLGFVAAAEPP